MQANDNVPWDTRESTPVERILDLRESASSSKQESPSLGRGECQSCVILVDGPRRLEDAPRFPSIASLELPYCPFCGRRLG